MSNTSNTDHQELAKDMTERAIISIQNQIQSHTIEVSKKKLDIDSVIKLNKGKTKKEDKQITTFNDLNEIKHSKIQELRQIQKQAIEMKKHQMLAKSKASKSCNKLWKSEFTEQDISQIKKIVKKQRRFQRQLKNKQKSLEDWVNQKRLQDQQLKKQYLSEKCQERKKDLVKQRQELQKKKQQRTLLLQQEIDNIKQKKNNKLLYLQMSQSWKRYEQTSEKQRARLWQMQNQKRKVNAKLIHQHQVKYLQKKKQQEKKREKALEQSHFHLPYIHSHCQLFRKVQEEEEDRIRQKEFKIRQIQENAFKRKQYGKHLNELLLSSTKAKTSNNSKQQNQEKHSKSKSPLKKQQQHKLGNDYMKAMHEKITNQDLQKMKKSLKIPDKKGGISTHYKNYLLAIKPTQKQNKGGLEAIQQTLNNKSLDEIDKIHKVKMIFEKDQRVKKSDTEWYQTLKSKMSVLNKIMNQ